MILIIIGSLPLISQRFLKNKFVFPDRSAAIRGILISSIVMIIFDQFVTGVFWIFNPKYITGIYLYKLPLEEVLFFIVVSFSTLCIWSNISSVVKAEHHFKYTKYVLLILSLLFIVLSSPTKLYTLSMGFILLLLLLVDEFLKIKLFASLRFAYLLGFLILSTTFFNYYLTSRPIVIYEPTYNLNVYVFTIPVEDYLFGIIFISLAIMIYENRLNSTSSKKLSK